MSYAKVELFTETGTALMLQLEEETKRWSGEHLAGVQRGDIEIAFEKIYAFASKEAEERGRRESLRGYAKELEDSADFYDKEISSIHKDVVAVLRAKASLLRERIEKKKYPQ